MNPSSQPSSALPPVPEGMPFKTDVVDNIPMQTQTTDNRTKDNDDVELDLMMQDVGQELKKNVKRPVKHHFFSRHSKAPAVSRPVPAAQPTPAAPQPTASMPNHQLPPNAQNQAQIASKAATKPKTMQSVPIFIILVTLIITGALIVVAVAAYKPGSS